ncbi:unnamed protein product [Mesocestoides corti]|uniref:Uncharacterized protein n=1 Tax=Mesocestoides corti TaxID=53468 RepID=A0A0R3U5Z1_MESCO|nr:unnamed protein product [Mesocestoides corti]
MLQSSQSNAQPKAENQEHYWKKPGRKDSSSCSSDDGEEKIMVERYWKREPPSRKGCEAPSGEEKIIISRLWKKKANTCVDGARDKDNNHDLFQYLIIDLIINELIFVK